jgi:hypothetical protein
MKHREFNLLRSNRLQPVAGVVFSTCFFVARHRAASQETQSRADFLPIL